MYQLDSQESAIVKALIRNPRVSDNKLGEEMEIPVRTVNRKRKRLEQKGIISYMTHVNMLPSGTGRFQVQHLFIIQFRLGITFSQIEREIRDEPNVITIFTELIFESYIAEIEVSTIRLLQPIRMLKNYLPLVNMKDGRLKKEWRLESIYVGNGK